MHKTLCTQQTKSFLVIYFEKVIRCTQPVKTPQPGLGKEDCANALQSCLWCWRAISFDWCEAVMDSHGKCSTSTGCKQNEKDHRKEKNAKSNAEQILILITAQDW